MDSECVPCNPETGEFLPFQEVSHRRGRKYGVDDAVARGYAVVVLGDAVRAVDREPGDGARALAAMRARGALVVGREDVAP